jgi:hypothetical protein
MRYRQSIEMASDQVIHRGDRVGWVAVDNGAPRLDTDYGRPIVMKHYVRSVLQFTSPASRKVQVTIVKIDVPLVLHGLPP